MFAQSLLEYGVLSNMRTALEGMADSAQDWIRDVRPTTWVVVAVVLLLVVRLWSRRK